MMRKLVPFIAIVASLAALGGLAQWRLDALDPPAHGGRGDKPLAVDTASVTVQPMPVSLQAVGQVEPEHTVQIRPQVSGQLRGVYFSEGDEVRKGQKLFLIDPSQYQTALTAAKAQLVYDEDQVKRLAPLAGKEYVTSQEYETAKATVDQDRAKLEQAEINLAYTDIRAPISGRTGSVSAKAGNLVAPTDAAPLVVINQMRPILVQYSLPQQRLDQLRDYQAQHSIRIFITREDGSGDLGAGDLVFVDNTVNTDTGTIMLKARIPNDREQLWPGQYVGVVTQLTMQPAALTVPQTAIQTGQNGNFVYLIEHGQAVTRDVKVNRQVGDLAVISSGLSQGEQVVSHVPPNLRPGINVVAIAAAKQERSTTAKTAQNGQTVLR